MTESANRRHASRASIAIAVKNKIGDRIYLCQASDISADGIFLANVLDELHPTHSRCALEFCLPGSRTIIAARGRVVRQTANGRYHLMAVRFSTIAPSHRRMIHRYVKSPTVQHPSPTFLQPRHAA
jgi:c-di-GMP-binding flagellar brake protein YcgR